MRLARFIRINFCKLIYQALNGDTDLKHIFSVVNDEAAFNSIQAMDNHINNFIVKLSLLSNFNYISRAICHNNPLYC